MNQAMLMRSVPALAVIGLASHAVWNDEGTLVPPEKKPIASVRLDKGLNDPQVLPAPARDPFDPLAGAPRTAPLDARQDQAARGPTGDAAATTAGGPTSPAVVDDPTTLFQLGATMVSGPRRCALINGRIHDIGEVITVKNKTGTRERYTLISIERDGVMLQGKSRRPVLVTFVAARDEPKKDPAVASADSGTQPSGAEMALTNLLSRSAGTSGQTAMPAMNILSLLGLGAAHP
jgi:hypothetical protein